MTFYQLGGIVSIIVAVVLILLFLIIRRIDETSKAGGVLMWIGMLFSVAGAALLTIEYSFPNISHPHVPSVQEHFVEFYGDQYYSFLKSTHEDIIVDSFIRVSYSEIGRSEEGDKHVAFYDTCLVYEVDEQYYTYSFLNKYVYSSDYSYQQVYSYEYN